MTLTTLSEREVFVTFLSLALLLVGAYLCGKLMEAVKTFFRRIRSRGRC